MAALARPILYSFRRCPYAIRARLAMQVAGSECELREVVLRDKAPEMLAASPKGTVPVLIQPDGVILEESLDIMLWALGTNDPQNWLQPEVGGIGDTLALIEQTERDFKFHLDRYKYATRYPGADPVEHRSAASEFLVALDSRLSVGPWLCGPRISLADVAIAPFVRQFANSDRQWFDEKPWSNLSGWLRDFQESPLFLSVMQKHPQWHRGDEPMLFPMSRERLWRRAL